MSIWGKVRQVFGSRPASGEAVSPEDLFASEVEAILRESASVTAIRRKPEEFALVVTQGAQERTLFLSNVFQETRDMSPDLRQQRIVRLVRSADAPKATEMTWEVARAQLVPLLRTSAFYMGVPFATGKEPIRRPFVPLLVECVGLDSDDSIQLVAPDMVTHWGVELAEVFAASVENAARHFIDDVGPFDPEAAYPLWHVARDDSYESSRLLLPGWLAAFDGKVKGRPVAIVPERSTLIVGGDGDEECLRRLVKSARAEFKAAPRRISPALYTIDSEGGVIPLVLAPTHALASKVALGHTTMAAAEYDVQQEHLQQRLGDEIFVAPFKGSQSNDGRIFSYTTWTQGAISLLPRADHVVLVTNPQAKSGGSFRVTWGALMDIARDCLVPEPLLDPPRWRATGWPDDAMVAKLRSVAVR